MLFCCGKKCKGMKGLKTHQCSCRTLHGPNHNLNTKLLEDILESAKETDVFSMDSQSMDIPENAINYEEIIILKRRVKLPKSAMGWSLANEHSKAVPSTQPIRNEGLDLNIERLNNAIFKYCRMTLESAFSFLLGFLHYLSLMSPSILTHPYISKSQKLFAK